jgi:DNA-binding response OmpR family regulator
MRVLLVDDEPSLLQLLGKNLARQGHSVESAPNAAHARAIITSRIPFDFALIDWTLPDGSGLDVARQLLERDSRVRVVFTSGYPLDMSLIPAKLRDRMRVLQKPFLPRALGEMMTNWPPL